MSQYYVQYLVTGTSKIPLGELAVNFDPLLLEQASLVLSSMLGCECTIDIDTIELLASESDREEE